ncbi:MAG: hypothetical protein HFG05_12935 [Oscillibacter sp.]|nr:hypothetical protein [Oscillibacter sp.]
MCQEMKNYVEFSFEGIKADWSTIGTFEVISPYIDYLRFSDTNSIQFHIKDSALEGKTKNEYIEECQRIFLLFYIQLIKEGSFPLSTKFEVNAENVQIRTKAFSFIGVCENLSFHESIKIQRYDKAGRVISPQKFVKEQQILLHNRIQQAFSDSVQNSTCISGGNDKVFLKLFQISDPVLRYFVTFSWLVELCGGQRATKSYIEQSDIYKNLGGIPKRGTRYDTRENKDVETDRFTYTRNLIGHSINEILKFSDQQVIGEVITLNSPLLKILLKKLEETPNGQP